MSISQKLYDEIYNDCIEKVNENKEITDEEINELFEDFRDWVRGKSGLSGTSAAAAKTNKGAYKKILDAAGKTGNAKAKPAPKPAPEPAPKPKSAEDKAREDAETKAFLQRQYRRLKAAGEMD